MVLQTPPSINNNAEIAIVGGGPSGLVFAAICERNGWSYILYDRGSRDDLPAGGCLDLHVGSGQLAMKEAGVFEEMQKYARRGAAQLHMVYDHNGEHVWTWGEDRDSPELDRHQIKQSLLTGIPEGKIAWRKILDSAERDEEGKIFLRFRDGSEASGFKLVVGADGIHSKVRPLITPRSPRYWGICLIGGYIRRSNPFFPKLHQKAGEGPMVVTGRSTFTWAQIQGTGDYGVDFGIVVPADFTTNGPVRLQDADAVKQLLLTDEYFGQHAQFFKDMLSAMEAPLHDWPLYEMPPHALNWQSSADVVLIGDAAHTTTPFIGNGANCAMRDSVILAQKLKEFGLGKDAVVAYEKEMFGYAKEMIKTSDMSGKLFFAQDAPRGFVETMTKTPFIGTSELE